MRIANPIFDVIFKYLLEDLDITRLLLSKIIGEEIIDITVQPQEHLVRSNQFDLIILRLDFKAIIKHKDGTLRKVLIELQKGKKPNDLLRFRRYLGDNYRKEDILLENGIEKKVSLPITTIYFLGFTLAHVNTAIMKVNRDYLDMITDKKIEAKEEFIEKLTHDSFVIQIPRLEKDDRTELERVLKIFNQSYMANDDNRILEISQQELEEDDLLKRMAVRLRNAAAEEDVLLKMEIEEEVESKFEEHIREKQDLIEQLKGIEGEKQGLIEEKQGLIEEKQGLIEEKQGLIEEKQGLIEELSEKDRLIEELKKQLGQK